MLCDGDTVVLICMYVRLFSKGVYFFAPRDLFSEDHLRFFLVDFFNGTEMGTEQFSAFAVLCAARRRFTVVML